MPSTPLTIDIDGMSCAACAARVEDALVQSPGLSSVSVNLATARATFDAEDDAAFRGAVNLLKEKGYPARTRRLTLDIENMSCASCVARVERALAAIPGVTDVAVNLATGQAAVTAVEGAVDDDAILAAASTAGYPANLVQAGNGNTPAKRAQAETAHLHRRVVQAALLAIPVFLLEMGGHAFPAFHHWIARTVGMETSWALQALLTTIVLFGPGRYFFTKGLPALFRGAPDMNSLVALGTGAAWSYSMVATFLPDLLPQGTRSVYFEAAAVIVLLILMGRWLEAGAKGRTGAAIEGLLGLQAKTARVQRGAAVEDVAIGELRPGDEVVIRPGERLPVDGTVLEGSSYVDESMISGEPLPVAKAQGESVIGGTINGTGALTIRADRVGQETVLAQIVRMVEDAQGAKLPIQGLVNRITLWFVPAVLALAALTFLTWVLLGGGLGFALVAAVSVLIIACPCAMGLATPTSIRVATGRAAELGVLFRKGDALQALAEVDVVALDKTGTLTEGKPTLTDIVLTDGFERADVLRAVASVEASSEHPIAGAILAGAQADGTDLAAVERFVSVTGEGVAGTAEGREVAVGSKRLMSARGVPTDALSTEAENLANQGRTALFAAIDGELAAVIGVVDPVKPTSHAAIADLKARGLEVALVTGDRRETAKIVAADLGIPHVEADLLPAGKVDALDALKAGGRRVAFVGDGINDAPALAHGDVGIAIGTGTDIAIESADVVLMSGDLGAVVNAFDVSKATMRNIRQNLGWAFGYNIVLIPIAAGALYPAFGLLLSPVFAAAAMALSSVSVVGNALRLRRFKRQPKPPYPPIRPMREGAQPAE
ncbi:MAG: heavy metal translocating P-type ATPase [Pseudomonadota bacterium]